PVEIGAPLEQHVSGNPDGAIRQIHVFPFGGMKKAAEWLHQRGSWSA
ncbi:MAG: methylenetetrahydrofolate reductase, partial [Gammaproteobacteria bacterium]|nr:methylenetetrahydrofolate reductase [Gammaproteobacteria bacterium]